MKTITFRTVLVVLVALFSLNANAYDVYIDGVYYNLVKKAKTAQVTSGDKDYLGKVVIPSSFIYEGDTYTVTSIGSHAFSNLNSLVDIQFNLKQGLKSIFLPSSIKEIDGSAFIYLPALQEVHIEDLTWWCNFNFAVEDHSAISPRVGGDPTDNPLVFAGHLFLNNKEITELIIPTNVTVIKNNTFRGCIGLKSVTIHNKVTYIGEGAFAGCCNLSSVIIPNSVTEIGWEAFSGCSGLTDLNIPNSVKSIGNMAFKDCSGLTSASIPNSVTSLDGTFQGCSSLKSVEIPEGVSKIGSRTFEKCSSLTSVTIPKSVTQIGSYAFSGCISINSISLPYNIGKEAFGLTDWGMSLTHVNNIDSYAFYGCKNITDIYCYTEALPKMGEMVFADAYVEYTTLHVPSSSIMSYKEDSQWGAFGQIVALTEEELIKNGVSGSHKEEGILFETEKAYSFQSKQNEYYMTLSDDGISIAEEPCALKFEEAGDGKYYITDGEYYVGLAGTDNWSMSSDPDKKEALGISSTIIGGETYYSFSESLGMVGVDWPKKDNMGCWADKKTSDGDAVLWLVKEMEVVDAIADVKAAEDNYQIYTIDGKAVGKLQKGMNIIRYKNGSVKKVLVK